MTRQTYAVALGSVLAIWFVLHQSGFFINTLSGNCTDQPTLTETKTESPKDTNNNPDQNFATVRAGVPSKEVPKESRNELSEPAKKLLDMFQTDTCKHVLWENPTIPGALSEGICFTKYSSLRLERFGRDLNRFYIPSSCQPPRHNDLCERRTWYRSPPIVESSHVCNKTDDAPHIIINRDHPNIANPYHRTTFDFFPLYALLTLIKEKDFRGVKLFLTDGPGRIMGAERILYSDIYKMFRFDDILLIPDQLREQHTCYKNAICIGSHFNWGKAADVIPNNGILTDFVNFVVSHIPPARLKKKPHPSILYLQRTVTRKIKNEDKILEHIRQKYPNVKLDIWKNTPYKNIIDLITEMRSYSMVFGSHGANFNHALFMRPKSTVFEILNYKYNVFMYKVMCSSSGKIYRSYVVKNDANILVREPHFADVTVNLDELFVSLDEAIDNMIRNPPSE